jgi:predicted nucleic acid-binding protein
MSGGYKVVYDTSALLEFFQGGFQGKQVKELLEAEEVENLIPTVVLCELVSKLKRTKMDPTSFISTLEENSLVLNLDSNTAKEAGLLHAELKEVEPGISLVDCVIMKHAEMNSAMIVSKDNHFKHYKKSKILG